MSKLLNNFSKGIECFIVNGFKRFHFRPCWIKTHQKLKNEIRVVLRTHLSDLSKPYFYRTFLRKLVQIE